MTSPGLFFLLVNVHLLGGWDHLPEGGELFPGGGQVELPELLGQLHRLLERYEVSLVRGMRGSLPGRLSSARHRTDTPRSQTEGNLSSAGDPRSRSL